jgi:hypothetical protein
LNINFNDLIIQLQRFAVLRRVRTIFVVSIGVCLLGQSATIYAASNTTSSENASIYNKAKTTSDSIIEKEALTPAIFPKDQSVDMGVDKFGIDMLYPSKSGGEEWYMYMTDPKADPRFNPQDVITRNSDGSWKIKSEKVRMYVYTSKGYNPHQITSDSGLSQVATRGFMASPKDWRDVEITGYVKLNKFSENDNFVWYTRGGKHTDSDPCQGSSYKGNLFYHGETQFAKEQWHVSYAKSPTITATSPLEGKWVGFKFVMYNTITPEGKLAVKLENWIDEDADGKNWIKVYEGADAGKWGRTGEECKVRADQILSWSGPLASFRWDFAHDVDFRNFSVREITGENGVLHGTDYFTGTSTSSNVPKFGNSPPFKELTGYNQNINGILRENFANNVDGDSSFATANSGNEGGVTGESFGQKQISSGNMVYVIWVQGDEDNTDLFLKISQDGGATFGDSINLSNNPASLSYNPQVVALGESVYIVWEDDEGNSGNSDVFFIKSSDGGKSFIDKRNLSDDPSGSGNPQLSISGNNVYVAWTGTSPDNTDIMLAQSLNNGDSFTVPENLSNDPEISFNPVLFVNGTHLNIEWKGQDDNGHTKIKSVSLPNVNEDEDNSHTTGADFSSVLNSTSIILPGINNNATEKQSQIQNNKTKSETTDIQNQTSALALPPPPSINSTEYISPPQVVSDPAFTIVNLSRPSGANSSSTIHMPVNVNEQEFDSTLLGDYNHTSPMATIITMPDNVELKDSTISSQENTEPTDTKAIRGASEEVLSKQSEKTSDKVIDISEDNALVQLKPIEETSASSNTVDVVNSQEVAEIPVKPVEPENEIEKVESKQNQFSQDQQLQQQLQEQLQQLQQQQLQQQLQEQLQQLQQQQLQQQHVQEKQQDQQQKKKPENLNTRTKNRQAHSTPTPSIDSPNQAVAGNEAEKAQERAQKQLGQEIKERGQDMKNQQQIEPRNKIRKDIAERNLELEARDRVLKSDDMNDDSNNRPSNGNDSDNTHSKDGIHSTQDNGNKEHRDKHEKKHHDNNENKDRSDEKHNKGHSKNLKVHKQRH